jgi:hypothetical protein
VDITGNVLREMEFQNNNTDGFVAEISVGEVPGGIYFLRVEGERDLITKSLVIAR